MTAKEQLKRAVDDFTEDDSAEVLQLLAQPRDLGGSTATEILNSIPGARESAQRGLEDDADVVLILTVQDAREASSATSLGF